MKQLEKNSFTFKTEKYIRENHIQLTRHQSAELRAKLPRSIYWIQITSGGLIQWNWTLLQSYLLNGDCPSHRDLVDKYMSTISQAA
jgi:hypothetical protein